MARNQLTQGRWLQQMADEATRADPMEAREAITRLNSALEYLRFPDDSFGAAFENQRLEAEARHQLGEVYGRFLDIEHVRQAKLSFEESIRIREHLVRALGYDPAHDLPGPLEPRLERWSS